MKKTLLIFFTILLSLSSYSQIIFEEGYFIDNSNQKISCLIRTIDWNNNPTEFQYKTSEKAEIKTANLTTVKEFGITNISKYIKAKVNIDRSSADINTLSKHRNPKFEEETLFLKVLIEGEANLYQYLDNGLIRFFYKKEDSEIKQLVYKSYKTTEYKIAENNHFRQQLLNALKCPDFKMNKFKNLEYESKELKQFFIAYSECLGQNSTIVEPKEKRDFFNLTIRPRYNSSSLTLVNATYNSKDVIDFGTKTGFGIGLEAEIVLPFDKNKWTLIIEPTYQSFKSETTNTDVSVIIGGELMSKIDYSSIEIPVGLRHTFFLKNESNIFVNISYVFDLNSKSSFEFDSSTSANTNTLHLETEQNLAFGFGYEFRDKFSLEIRYQTSRELIKMNRIWSSDYKTFSIILGYSIF